MVIEKRIEFIKPMPSFNQLKLQERNAKMVNGLVTKAISFANDSMLTKLCLQFSASQIAAAILYMSAQVNKMKPTTTVGNWLDALVADLDIDSFTSIVKQIIELIADKKGVDRSVFAPIEADLKMLKKTMNSNSNGGSERDAKRRRT